MWFFLFHVMEKKLSLQDCLARKGVLEWDEGPVTTGAVQEERCGRRTRTQAELAGRQISAAACFPLRDREAAVDRRKLEGLKKQAKAVK
jgi:hypothetical protein